MLDTSRSLRLAALAAVSLLALASGCTDDTSGPGTLRTGRLAIAPDFGVLQVGVVDIARGRFVLTRIPGGAVAADTVITIAPDADSVALAIQVPVLTAGETFNLTIRLIDTAGDTVFAGGPIEVSPTTSGTPVPVAVPFEYVGTGANAAGVLILSPDTSTFTGETVLLTAAAFDSSEAPIPGTPIGWQSLDTARVRVTTDAQDRGVAVGGSQRGVARIVAILVTGQRDTVLIANQPLPTTLAAESGNNQSGGAGSTLSQPLVARVTAADGLGVRGLWVRFTVTSGGGSVSVDSVLTDSTGRASVNWTLVRSFQPNVVTATTARLGTASAVFNATLVFGAPATLAIVAGDGQTAVVGTAVAIAPRVRLLDAQGLPVPGVTVTFAVTGGSGIVAGGTPVTDTLGLAAVTSWTLGTTIGPNGLRAAVGGLNVTFAATGVAAAAARLVFTAQPSTVPVGTTITPPVVVTAYDAFGNVASGFAGGVQVALLANPGGATLSGTLTRSAVAGVATFDDLSLSAAGAGYTLAAAAAGLTSAASTAFDVLAAAHQIRWINAAGGDWNTAANWDLGRVPAVQDSVTIDLAGSYVVTLGTTTAVATMRLGGTGSTPTLRLAPTADVALTVADGLTNAGTIELTDVGFPNPTVTLTVTSGTLVNTGTIVSGAVWGGPRTITATIDNRGTIVATANSLTIQNAGRTFVTNAGTLNVGALLVLNGGTVTFGTGTQLLGSGTIRLPAGTALTLASDFTVASGSTYELDLAGANGGISIDGPGTLIVADTLEIGADIVNAPLVAQGVVQAQYSAAINGSLSVPTGGRLRLAPLGAATLTVANGFTNQGVIELADVGFPNPVATLTVTTGTLVNAGTITTAAVWGGTRVLDAAIQNQGTMEAIGAPLTLANTGRTFTTTTGTIGTGPGQLVTLNGGTVVFGSGTQVTGSGTLRLPTGTLLTLASDFTLPAGPYQLDLAGTGGISVDGPGALIMGDTLDIAADVINAPLVVGGVVLTQYNALVNGAVSVLPGGLLRVTSMGQATLALAAGLVNAGTIELGDAGFPNPVATLAVGSGTLVNRGTLRTTAVWGGTRTVNASLEHRGLVSLATPLTITGQLIVPQDAGDVGVEGNGAALTVAGLDVSWLYFANTPLISTGGTITRFDNVRFDNMATDAVQLTINHPGAATPFTFRSLWFRTTPTTGRYIRANDTNTGDGTPLTIAMAGSTPADGSAYEEELNGAVINWIPVGGINDWVGGSGLWTEAAHWSLGRAPIPGDTVRIIGAGDYTVTMDASATVAKLLLGGTADPVTLNASGWALTITDPGPDLGLEILSLGRIVLSETGLLADRLTNQGTIVAGGSLIQSSAFTNLGTLEVQWGELVISHPTSYDLQTSGTLQVDDGARLTLSTNGGLTYLGGSIAGGAASTGVIRLLPNVPLVLGADLTYNNLIIESIDGSVIPQAAQQLTVGQFAEFRASGPGVTQILAPVVANGIVDIRSGQLRLGATAALNTTGVLRGAGVLDGTGLTGPGLLAGSINPGDQPAALAGVLTWLGDFAPDPPAVLNIDIGGAQAGTQHDRFDVQGAVELDGTLRVTLRDGFTPAAGDRFPVMTFTSAASGSAFATLDFPALGALRLDTLTVDGGANPDVLYLVTSIAAAPVVFVGDSVGGSSNGLFRVEAGGSGFTKLLDFTPTMDAWPRWAPDRARIVFSYPIAGAGTANALRAITADGSVFVTVASDTSMRRPRFSPNGRHLAFECGDGGYDFGFQAQDVCVIPDVPANVASMSGIGNSDGKRYVTDDVSTTLGGSGAFAWNPLNPNQLAVVRDPQLFAGGPFTSEIWLVSFDGTTAQSLTGPIIHNDAPLRIVSMDWAPGGGFIAFEAVNQQSSERAIYRVELASGAITQLTSSGAQSVDDWRPVVSPDDSEILFARAGDGYSLYRIPSGTPNAEVRITPLLNLTTYSNRWDWSPDGAEIVHATDQLSGGTFIARLPRTTTQATYLTDVVVVGRGGAVEDRQPSWRP